MYNPRANLPSFDPCSSALQGADLRAASEKRASGGGRESIGVLK